MLGAICSKYFYIFEWHWRLLVYGVKMQNSKSLSSFKKIPNRYTSIVLPFLLSIIMTFVVSMVSTLRSLGLEEFSIYVWMSAWTISWLIAFPTLLLVLPVVRKITAILVQPA